MGTYASTTYAIQTLPRTPPTTIAEQLQTASTKTWEDLTAEALNINEIEHLLKDMIAPPVPLLGQVRSCLKHLNTKKATAADKIPAWFLNRHYHDVTPAIHSIITSSIIQCKYPTEYRHALITPVPKIPSPTDIDNDFRQI